MELFSALQERSNSDSSLRFSGSTRAARTLQWRLAFWFSSHHICEVIVQASHGAGEKDENRHVKLLQSSLFFLRFSHYS